VFGSIPSERLVSFDPQNLFNFATFNYFDGNPVSNYGKTSILASKLKYFSPLYV